MKKEILILTSFIFLFIKLNAQELPSLNWPVDNPSFLTMFASPASKAGVFEPGIVLSEEEFAKASQYGKKLIIIEKKRGLRGFPSALGNAVIIAHEAGLQTVYGGLADEAFTAETNIESNSIIGRFGKTACNKQNGIIFQVIDAKEKIFINPIKLLPYHNIKDKLSPIIKNAVLVNEKGITFDMEAAKYLKQGKYDLYASIKEGVKFINENFTPSEISIFVNGITVGRIPFYELESIKGEVYLKNTKLSAETLYKKEDSIYLGKISLTRGKNEIIISTIDSSQNETKATYSLKVD